MVSILSNLWLDLEPSYLVTSWQYKKKKNHDGDTSQRPKLSYLNALEIKYYSTIILVFL